MKSNKERSHTPGHNLKWRTYIVLIAPCNLIIIVIIIFKVVLQWEFMNGNNNTESSVTKT